MSDTTTRLRLAELTCARMSHDLSGTIGTLLGALDLADDPAAAADVLNLARDAANELRLRLELLRASWGPAAGPLGVAEISRFAAGLPHAARCRLDVSALPPDLALPSAMARVLLNLLLLAGDAMNGSGAIRVSGDGTALVVAIAGPRAAWPAGLADCLASEAAAWAALTDARSLPVPLTALLARAGGLRLTLLPPPALALRLQAA
jgi:hypothetical protein